MSDVIVLGVGLAARSAALEAAACGLRVSLVTGTQGALRRAEAAFRARQTRFAVEDALSTPVGVDGRPADPAEIAAGLRPRIDALLRQDVAADLLQACLAHPGIELCATEACFVGPRAIRSVDGRRWDAPIVVIATDALPRRPQRFRFDDRSICDADSIWLRRCLPRSALILGADAEGCALASTLAAAGVPVTLVDRRSRSLRYLDRDLLEDFQEGLLRSGVELVLSEELEEVRVEATGPETRVIVRLASGRSEVCDVVAVAGGCEPRTRPLELDRAAIDVDARGFVLTDERGETSRTGVFAAGRVVSDVGLYADEYYGRTIVRSALGLTDEGVSAVPLVVGSLPEIAMVGVTAEMCERLDLPHVSASAEFRVAAWQRLPALGPPGRLKLVVERRTRSLLGVQALGFGASDLVQLGLLLVAKQRSARELLRIAAPDGSPWASYASAARDALRLALA